MFASATACEGPEADSEDLGSGRPREGFVYHSRAMPSQTALIHAVHRSNDSTWKHFRVFNFRRSGVLTKFNDENFLIYGIIIDGKYIHVTTNNNCTS